MSYDGHAIILLLPLRLWKNCNGAPSVDNLDVQTNDRTRRTMASPYFFPSCLMIFTLARLLFFHLVGDAPYGASGQFFDEYHGTFFNLANGEKKRGALVLSLLAVEEGGRGFAAAAFVLRQEIINVCEWLHRQ